MWLIESVSRIESDDVLCTFEDGWSKDRIKGHFCRMGSVHNSLLFQLNTQALCVSLID